MNWSVFTIQGAIAEAAHTIVAQTNLSSKAVGSRCADNIRTGTFTRQNQCSL